MPKARSIIRNHETSQTFLIVEEALTYLHDANEEGEGVVGTELLNFISHVRFRLSEPELRAFCSLIKEALELEPMSIQLEYRKEEKRL